MKDSSWLGGLWGTSTQTGLTSYAAGDPESQDLLIADLAEMDSAGELPVDALGHPILSGVSLLVRWVSLLVRWDEVAWANFIPG